MLQISNLECVIEPASCSEVPGSNRARRWTVISLCVLFSPEKCQNRTEIKSRPYSFTSLRICYLQVNLIVAALHNKPKAEVHPGHKLTGPKEEEEELSLLLCLTY
jgi:hypothetical protein